MNKTEVTEMIAELEQSDATYQNCNDLAALYKVRDEFDKVKAEIDDILPAYKRYVEVKKNYQQGKASKDSVLDSQNLVCREIFDLIKTLYSCSDMPLERINVQNLVKAAYDALCYR